jgi:hypothetical protein
MADAEMADKPVVAAASGRAKRDRKSTDVFKPEVKEVKEKDVKQVGAAGACMRTGRRAPIRLCVRLT